MASLEIGLASPGRLPYRCSMNAGRQQDERRALALASAGFATLAVGDAVIKTMAGSWPPVAVAALRFDMGALMLAAILARAEGFAGFIMPKPRLQWLRGLGMTIATTSFFSALFVLPLAEATAIFFVSPMITALAATFLLGEPARRSTWLASFAAFAGVMIVLRPNFAEFGWQAVLPLIAACGFSMMVIGNRLVAGSGSGLQMQFFLAATGGLLLTVETLVAGTFGLGGMVLGWPPLVVILRCALVTMTATTGHWLIYTATTRVGAATIAPMTYLQLLVSVLLGWLMFGERPDWMAALGTAIIIGAGLYLWRTGRARALAENELP